MHPWRPMAICLLVGMEATDCGGFSLVEETESATEFPEAEPHFASRLVETGERIILALMQMPFVDAGRLRASADRASPVC